MSTTKDRIRAKRAEHIGTVGGALVPRIPANTWLPIDKWIRAYEAHRDPTGHYGSIGLLNGRHGWGVS